ncbi:MAG: glycosyltransferase family 4 protein [Planctomycetia bacterium]|nr:glycosyltransferase family 4 protein [Planctomycetia bacterium]
MIDNFDSTVADRMGDPRPSRPAQSDPSVLIVAASLRYVGGQSVMAKRLLEDLRTSGLRVEFLPVDPRPPWPFSHLDGVKYLRTIVRSFFYVLSLMRTVPRHDVIHVFSASYWSFLISPAPAIFIGRLFRKRVILNYHSGEAADHLRRSGRFTRWLMGLADCLLVQSEYLAGVFRAFGFAVAVIPNHVDLAAMIHRRRSAIVPLVLVPRALEPLYNIPCALRAFQIVQQERPKARMTILGEGSQRQELESMVKEIGLQGVTFTGSVQREQIPRVYDEHDVILNTSSIDNMPVSLLEGLAAGLTIVSTGPGGIPEMIADGLTGHIVAIDDHEAAAARILELAANPAQVARLSGAGRESVRRYTWEAVAPLWKALYRGDAAVPVRARAAKSAQLVGSCKGDEAP